MGIRPDPAVSDADCSSTDEEQLEVLKRCTKCEDLKPTSDFYPYKRAHDGFRHTCKTCSVSKPKTLARERAWCVYKAIKCSNNPTAPRNRSKTNPEGLSLIDLLERWLSQ